MSKRGKLTVENYGATMPLIGEAVQKPPFYYRDMEMMFITYITDTEAALKWLPDVLDLPEPALATIVVGRYESTTFGGYNEAIIFIHAEFKGEIVSYTPALFTDSEAPLIGGREIWGFAKKLAHIEIKHESEVMMGTVERPLGNRLLTASMRKVTPVADMKMPLAVSLKMIPCATENPRPALAQLIGTNFDLVPQVCSNGLPDIWSGPGSVHFNTPSAIDPWYRLPVREVVRCVAGRFDATLGYGKILAEL